MLALHRDAAEFNLTEGKTRGSAVQDGELRIFVRWGPEHPLCPGCRKPLKPGAANASQIRCDCGRTLPTFPPPDWMVRIAPTARRVIGALPEGDVPAPDADPHTGPIVFGCLSCGANLNITTSTTRILRCEYCDSEQFLPNAVWQAMHPVKARPAWWVEFTD
jgi:DNA-directed RNA polymerase subunit RPC12/RpoP